MREPRYCKDCKWSAPEENYEWNLRCIHPTVNMDDAWALSSPKINGTSCREERERKFFAPCGKAGRLWEPKP